MSTTIFNKISNGTYVSFINLKMYIRESQIHAFLLSFIWTPRFVSVYLSWKSSVHCTSGELIMWWCASAQPTLTQLHCFSVKCKDALYNQHFWEYLMDHEKQISCYEAQQHRIIVLFAVSFTLRCFRTSTMSVYFNCFKLYVCIRSFLSRIKKFWISDKMWTVTLVVRRLKFW